MKIDNKPATSTMDYIKILLISMMAILPLAVNAGDLGGSPVYDASRPERLLEFKPSVAIGLSSIQQNYGRVIPGLSDFQLAPGIMARVGLDVRFAVRRSFAIGTGIALDCNHSKYALSIIDNNSGSINSIYVRNSYQEVHVPVYAQWRLFLGNQMYCNVDAGGYLAFGIDGNMHASGYISGHNSLGQPVITHVSYNTKYFKDGESLINGIKSNDYGVHIATGLTYRQHYSIGLVFELSIPNLAINHDVIDARYRNVNAALEIGYNF